MKALLVVAGLLLALLGVADRVAVGVAEDRVAALVAQRGALPTAPEVDIAGFPFLTQALAGRYDEVRIGLSAAQLDQPEGTSAEVALRGARVPLSAALTGAVQEVPVERIDGTATLSYDRLAEGLGADATVVRDGNGVRIEGSIDVGGRAVPLSAVAEISVEGADVVVDVTEAAGVGGEVPDGVLDEVTDALDLRYTVPALPFGLRVTGIRAADDGVAVAVESTETVLAAGNGAPTGE